MRTTTVNESVKVIRKYVGKEVTVRKEDTVETLRVIGYSVSTMGDMKILAVILEDNDNDGWEVIKDIIDTKAGEKVYARFIDKGIKARFENTFVIDEFRDLTATDYKK